MAESAAILAACCAGPGRPGRAGNLITLALATLGFVHVPGPPIEAAIALSVVFVAAEISRNGGRRREEADSHEPIRLLTSSATRPSLTTRVPWVVAFTFGLLHGFGFAGALSEVGLPQSAIPVALLCFNVGVELGQLSVIACVLVIIGLTRQITRRIGVSQPAWAWRVPPYAISGIALFWVFQRLTAF